MGWPGQGTGVEGTPEVGAGAHAPGRLHFEQETDAVGAVQERLPGAVFPAEPDMMGGHHAAHGDLEQTRNRMAPARKEFSGIETQLAPGPDRTGRQQRPDGIAVPLGLVPAPERQENRQSAPGRIGRAGRIGRGLHGPHQGAVQDPQLDQPHRGGQGPVAGQGSGGANLPFAPEAEPTGQDPVQAQAQGVAFLVQAQKDTGSGRIPGPGACIGLVRGHAGQQPGVPVFTRRAHRSLVPEQPLDEGAGTLHALAADPDSHHGGFHQPAGRTHGVSNPDRRPNRVAVPTR